MIQGIEMTSHQVRSSLHVCHVYTLQQGQKEDRTCTSAQAAGPLNSHRNCNSSIENPVTDFSGITAQGNNQAIAVCCSEMKSR